MEAVTRDNYKRCPLEKAGILACTTGRAKKVAVSESGEIVHVAYLGQITSIEIGRAGKNYKNCASRWARILACANGRKKEVAVLESREIKWVVYLGQITNIRSDRM